MIRPFTETSRFYGGAIDVHICRFCDTPCVDQTLESWESCCESFELRMLLIDIVDALDELPLPKQPWHQLLERIDEQLDRR